MRNRIIDVALLCGLALCASALRASSTDVGQQITIASGKTHLIDTDVNIERVSVAAPEVAEAVPVSPRTLMVNGRGPGETSLVLWLDGGTRQVYTVTVRAGQTRFEAAKKQTEMEFGGKVQLTADSGAVYLTGMVKDLYASQRAIAIAEGLGKVVNLLKVEVPPQETQILLKVRFADVDRNKATDLGINFAGAPAGFPFSATVGTYSPSRVTSVNGTNGGSGSSSGPTISFSDALNLLFFDPHLNLGATLKDLQSKAVLQVLAEPNVLAMNGHEASFVAGGEFPFPTLQGGGSGLGQVTVSFREFGVRIHFLPRITPRGTIRLHVTPEVSSLDYANGLAIQGFTIPALNTRRIDTDIELQNGQSFAIAGLLDQRTTELLSKIPGLGDIPVLGKIFQTRSLSKSNSELLVIVTPELVAPIPDVKDIPDLQRPLEFLKGPGILSEPPRTPGVNKTGPVPVKVHRDDVPVQEMEKMEREQQTFSGPPANFAAPPSLSGTRGTGSDSISLTPASTGAGDAANVRSGAGK